MLDAGCGTGGELVRFAEGMPGQAALIGIDIRRDRLIDGRAQSDALHLVEGDARQLPFDDGRFDAVLAYTLFSSILDAAIAHRVSDEIARVLRPGAPVVWYDSRVTNPRNPNTRPWRRDEVAELFPGFAVRARSVTLVPPVARALRWAPWLYAPLSRLPMLRTHLVGVLVKPVGGG